MSESLANETENLGTLTQELQDHRRLIEQRQIAFRDGQLALNEINKQIEQHKQAILDVMRRLANTNSRLDRLVPRPMTNTGKTQSGDGERLSPDVAALIERLDRAQADDKQREIDRLLAELTNP